ncbi:MAG TPA: S-adenosylmethionine:tRNA ribosyltransferase-isomerase, partial [Bacteroidales bacterium]|nr:S-adenosylmethionine:tRNA ribosyltransferase-isomerase [Bacteroidales bacterium]
MNVKDLPASVYHYPLPPERIALHPLPERDASLLLVSDGNEHRKDVFRHLEQYIPPQSLFVFNDTRVVHARLLFRKPSGARIEIFLLEPLWPVAEVQQAFQQSSGVRWKCLVGNSRRWASGALVLTAEALGGTLTALREEQHADFSVVRFEWQPAGLDFASVVAACGKVPLPPYIHREAIAEDDLRYQTVYARHDGSVAAPTAGLHFTPEVMQTLEAAGHRMAWVTLHVGAGTFRPVSSA